MKQSNWGAWRTDVSDLKCISSKKIRLKLHLEELEIYDLPVFSLSTLLCCRVSALAESTSLCMCGIFFKVLLGSTESLYSDWKAVELNKPEMKKRCKCHWFKKCWLTNRQNNWWKWGLPFFSHSILQSSTVLGDSRQPLPPSAPPQLHKPVDRRWENNIQPGAKGHCIWNCP